MTSLQRAAGPHHEWKLPLTGGRHLQLTRRSAVMGIVNITPDSFSDGGAFLAPQSAIDHGLELAAEGADMLDLGAESTRPGGGVYGKGYDQVEPGDELDRLLPVLAELRRQLPELVISVDTRKAEVAREALAHGADLINDVGGLSCDRMIAVVAEAGCPVIAMHSRGELRHMQTAIAFTDVAGEVRDEQAAMLGRAQAGGIDIERIIVDPGIGFGKTTEQNLTLLGQLDILAALGRPILIGASRKSFVAAIRPAAPKQRLGGSLAAAAWAAHYGAALLRVHDVAATRQFLDVWNAIDSTS